jgi:ParB family chromosome partitioning protein
MTKPPRLGRGLSALLGDAPAPAAAPAGEGGRMLPIEALEPGPFQPRGAIQPQALEELAASIRAHGVLQPILVRAKPGAAGTYQIIGGERRWRASQLAQLHEVPVVIRALDDRAAMAAALVENLQRQDLNPLEEAEGLRRLLDEFGQTQEALADAVGKSRSHVGNMLRLLSLPPPVREMLRQGALSAGHARALLTAADPALLAVEIVGRGLNVRQTEALVAAKAAGRAPKPAARPSDTAALERELSAKLGLKVQVKHRGKAGEVVLQYRDLDQLDGLIQLLVA